MAVTAAAAPSGLNWTAFNLASGEVIFDSAQVIVDNGQPLTTMVGQVSTTTVTLNLDATTPSPDWIFATEKGAAGWVCWTGSELNPTIVWGGIVLQRVRNLGPEVTIQLATPECYLEACPVSGYTANSVNQDMILNQLVTQFAAGTNRLNWQLIQSANPSTVAQSVSYAAGANVSVLSALQSLSAASTGGVSGPEWMTGWQWNVSAGTILPTITYGQRVGNAAVNGVPKVTIELADLMQGSAFTEDYTAGHGANSVTAFGSASSGSSSVPSATATASNLAGRPLWTYTFTPAGQISDPTVLAGYAARALSALQSGNQPIIPVLQANQVGKTYGVDWFLGDDIGWYLYGGYQFPIPVSGVGRVIGTQVTQSTVTPIIQGAVLS